MTIDRITTNINEINLDDYEPVSDRKFRFQMNGKWTRFYTDKDDLTLLYNTPIDAIEVIETIKRKGT